MSSEQEIVAPATAEEATIDPGADKSEPVLHAEDSKEEPVVVDPPAEPLDKEVKVSPVEPADAEKATEKTVEPEKASVAEDAVDQLAAKTSELEVTA